MYVPTDMSATWYVVTQRSPPPPPPPPHLHVTLKESQSNYHYCQVVLLIALYYRARNE